ncbi:MAG: DUF2723 domain-containing protein [Flavobacteriales bacterium]|jgi:tetratricopeptide (TPR) repeat protein|tara:strand:- start:6734 stop:10252 length:3519 start_codon:yes stop_codon:yes gene_type:complete
MTYHKLNVYSGWFIWLIATIVYLLTIEPTTSFWDCGEFISSAYKLQVGHPPGAPFFMLVARFFAMWFGPEHVAMAMNGLSALCSSFTILFLFWSITHFAKKLAVKVFGADLDTGATWAVMASGAVGALAYTFSDSFWFSAVEGEVYAMSSLFTAVVFWAILKWESMSDKGGGFRWLVLIAYLMGLSIGVHLLNLLAIPAIAFVYYFKRHNVTVIGLAITALVSLVVLGFIQGLIIPGTIKLASKFELYMVNDMGMPFNSGVIVYIMLIILLIVGMLFVSKRQNWPIVNTSVLSIMMVLIGYSTFALVVIRSSANPPMDENNPENVFTLLSYLNREQYGSRPLLTGQYWNTPINYDDPYSGKSNNYVKSFSVKNNAGAIVKSYKFVFEAEEYIENNSDKDLSLVEEYIASEAIDGYNYVDELTAFLPRMHSTDARDIEAYKEWSNFKGWNEAKKRPKVNKDEKQLKEVEAELNRAMGAINYYAVRGDQQGYSQAKAEFSKKYIQLKRKAGKLMPTQGENMRFFADYQVGWMYWRYFMWNFSGKQNDVQGHGDILDGNWLTGIDLIDQEKLGNRDMLTSYMEGNRGLNKFFLLPFLLGLIGFVFQLVKAPKDFTVSALLFLLTGLAIVVYLNQDPFQPRERDYAYVGSFYAFALWIGLSIMGLYYAATKMVQKELFLSAGAGLGIGVILYLLEFSSGQDHFTSLCILFMAAVAALVLVALQMGVKPALDSKQKAILCGVIGMTVPFLMMSDGWDDHSRAGRRTGGDFAQNYLMSLEANALIFTNGDNDTFPLWYAQEVEGVRTDVRVVNLSLLQTDWYADQMKRKAYDGEAVPIGLKEEQYRQGTRDFAEMNPSEEYVELSDQFNFFLDDERFKKENQEPYFPSNKWKLTVDSADVVNKGVVSAADASKIVPVMRWERNGKLLKNSILVYDIIRNNNWERPIYFASTIGQDAFNGLQDYFQLEGLAYRLVPIKTVSQNPLQVGRVNTEDMYDNVMNKFKWGNMQDTVMDIYLDENNLRMVSNLRMQFANLADALTEEGQKDKAVIVLDKCFEVMPEEVVRYDEQILYLAEEYVEAGEKEKGTALFERYFELIEEKLDYLESLDPNEALSVVGDFERDFTVLSYTLRRTSDTVKDSVFLNQIGGRFESNYENYLRIEATKRKEYEERRSGKKGDF